MTSAIEARDLRRAAMDYGEDVPVRRHVSWDRYQSDAPSGRRVLFTVRADVPLSRFALHPDDHLVFGRESAGVPDIVHDGVDARVVIPIADGARSLNLANAATAAAYIAFRALL